MGSNASVLVCCGLAEISVRGTDRLHNTDECVITVSYITETK